MRPAGRAPARQLLTAGLVTPPCEPRFTRDRVDRVVLAAAVVASSLRRRAEMTAITRKNSRRHQRHVVCGACALRDMANKR